MATYTHSQLKDDGTPTEALAGAKTFTFLNPGTNGSAYFVFETVRAIGGVYDTSSVSYAIGTYDTFSTGSGYENLGLVTSNYIFSTVVPPGTSSFNFTPTTNVPVSGAWLRGTGEFTLTIS